MRIGIIGAGGIGGYLAARLCQADGDVALVARGAHGAAIARDGLTLVAPDGTRTVRPGLVTDDPARAGPCDLVIFGVKAHQMDAAIAAARPMVGPGTLTLSFQNGVDAPEMLGRAFGADAALIGVARIFVNITGPAEITLRPGARSFTIGDARGRQDGEGAARVIAAFRQAGIEAPDCDDVRADLWMKFLLFNAVSSTTAGARTTMGTVRDTPELWRLFGDLVRETEAVARAGDIDLPGDAAERILRYASEIPAEARASTAHDLDGGRPLEIDWTCGAVARLGAAHGVPAPASRTVWSLLAPWRDGAPDRRERA